MSIQHFLKKQSGLILRGVICWSIGLVFLMTDETNSYDTRLQIRGDQKVSSEIILVLLRPSDILQNQHSEARFSTRATLFDSTFWDDSLWHRLLQKILSENPKTVGVTLTFPDQVYPPPESDTLKLIGDARVHWSYQGPTNDRNFHSPFSKYKSVLVGRGDAVPDEDGVVRRYNAENSEIPQLAEALTNISLPAQGISRLINFRGGAKSFQEINASDVLSGGLPAHFFKNKIVIIGAEGIPGSRVTTPVGVLSKSHLLAHEVDNLVHDRWILRLPFVDYAVFLFLVILVGIFLMDHYPPTIASTMLIWLCLMLAALSIWVFDTWYVWLPVISGVTMITVTWIVFVGYQAYRMEKRSWLLEQTHNYQLEMEQLKNNFVSLISHDLKTPIAKIQSISDRLLSTLKDTESAQDIINIRAASDELNKYIQSILKLLRVESRDLKIQREACDINSLIEEVFTQIKPLATAKNIDLKLELEPLFTIEADLTLIREVLVNLIENAVKYTPDGGKVRVLSHEINDFVEVIVEDTGHGIPKAEQEAVWNKFVRGSKSENQATGTGLGLYLVKFFIELHGGKVHLESELEKGTRVSFLLPLDSDSAIPDTNELKGEA